MILDKDLASIYGVTTKRLNEQVKRNLRRFPEDFVFQVSESEAETLRSQIATSKLGARDSRGGVRYLPYAFTEHGAIQAANVLNSSRAIEMGIFVVRAFIKLREVLAANAELARRLDELETKIESGLKQHDDSIAAMLSAIRQLLGAAPRKRRGIGFTADLSDPS